MPNGTVAVGRTTSFMERWVASLGQVATATAILRMRAGTVPFEDSDISTEDSVLDY